MSIAGQTADEKMSPAQENKIGIYFGWLLQAIRCQAPEIKNGALKCNEAPVFMVDMKRVRSALRICISGGCCGTSSEQISYYRKGINNFIN